MGKDLYIRACTSDLVGLVMFVMELDLNAIGLDLGYLALVLDLVSVATRRELI